jgi:hypothetical protein
MAMVFANDGYPGPVFTFTLHCWKGIEPLSLKIIIQSCRAASLGWMMFIGGAWSQDQVERRSRRDSEAGLLAAARADRTLDPRR